MKTDVQNVILTEWGPKSNYRVLFNSNFHLIRRKTLPTNDFELTVPNLYVLCCYNTYYQLSIEWSMVQWYWRKPWWHSGWNCTKWRYLQWSHLWWWRCYGSWTGIKLKDHLFKDTANTLDTIEAFIAETYVQLVATEAMCYSTTWSALLGSVLANTPMQYSPTLYCAVP